MSAQCVKNPARQGKIVLVKVPATARTAPGHGRTNEEFDMSDTSPERWVGLPGFEGFYEISDQGRLRSLDRTTSVSAGRVDAHTRSYKGKLLKQARHPAGYMYISLHAGGKKRPNCKVHHLVLEAFVGGRPPGMIGCHNNDIPDDNRLVNLRWDTPESNVRDFVRNGCGRRTHCKRGHEFTPENTRLLVNGQRRCRACQTAWHLAQYQPKARTLPYKKGACR